MCGDSMPHLVGYSVRITYLLHLLLLLGLHHYLSTSSTAISLSVITHGELISLKWIGLRTQTWHVTTISPMDIIGYPIISMISPDYLSIFCLMFINSNQRNYSS